MSNNILVGAVTKEFYSLVQHQCAVVKTQGLVCYSVTGLSFQNVFQLNRLEEDKMLIQLAEVIAELASTHGPQLITSLINWRAEQMRPYNSSEEYGFYRFLPVNFL